RLLSAGRPYTTLFRPAFDLEQPPLGDAAAEGREAPLRIAGGEHPVAGDDHRIRIGAHRLPDRPGRPRFAERGGEFAVGEGPPRGSEEHTSELQSREGR